MREALHRLEAEGLVTILSQRGATVTELEAQDIAEFHELRVLLEGAVTELAVPRITDSDIESMRGLAEAMEEATRQARVQDWVDLNQQFHMVLYGASGKRHFLRLIDRTFTRTRPYISLYLGLGGNLAVLNADHGGILEMASRRDIVGTRQLVEQNIRRSGAGLSSFLERLHGDH